MRRASYCLALSLSSFSSGGGEVSSNSPPSFSATKPSSLSSDSTVRVRATPTRAPSARLGRVGGLTVVIAPRLERLEHRPHLAARRVGALEEVLLDRDVVGREQQHAARRLVVAPAAPGLLRVLLERAGHVVVHHVADVALVDAEAERVGRDHDQLRLRRHEPQLLRVAIVLVHAAVVLGHRDAVACQRLVQLLDLLDRRAVDDAGPRQLLEQRDQRPVLVVVAREARSPRSGGWAGRTSW